MDESFTLEDLAQFTREEAAIAQSLGLTKEEEIVKAPQHIVDNVLNYSKALSVRKSEKLGTIEMLLN